MTWVSHKIITFCVVYTLSHNLPFSLLATVGAVLPDALEGKGFLNPTQRQSWAKKHRKSTHWFVPYLVVFLLSLMVLKNPLHISFKQIQDKVVILWWLSSGLSLGALLHILEDAISGKVPFLNPQRKSFGVRLIPTKSVFEGVFTLLIAFIFIFVVRK